MITKTKTILLLFTALALTLFGCSEEIYEYQNQTKKNNQISFKQFKAETQITNFELSTSVNLSGQRGRSLPTDFVIDTTKILNCISSTNKKTYTFRIAPISSALESNEFYNLVYKKVDNQWQQLIFKNKEINLSNGKNKLDSSNLVYSSASKNQNSTEGLCTVILAIDNCDGSCSEAGYSHCDGNQCSTGVCSTTYQVTTSDCGSGGGVGGSNSGGTSSPIGNTVTIPVVIPGGGGGTPTVYIPDPNETVFYSNPFDGNDILDPSSNAMTTLKLQIAAFTRELSTNNPAIKHLLESDVQIFNVLAAYFVNNGFTAPNKTFVQNTLITLSAISQLNFTTYTEDQKATFNIWALNYLLENNTAEDQQYISQFITQQQLNPDLSLDLEKSVKSPFFIDVSTIDNTTLEGTKFTEVYNKLMQSSSFRHLFVSLFGQSPLINVKFKIVDIPQPNTNSTIDGNCFMTYKPNQLSSLNTIQVDRNHLLTKSKLNIALTILHECIHAYLNVKLRNPTVAIPLSQINNMDFQSCVDTYYNGFSGNQTEHSFMVDNMIPTMVQIFQEIQQILLTPQEIDQLEIPTTGATILHPPMPNVIPPYPDSETIQWNWTNFYSYFSYIGLQNCTAYPAIFPVNSHSEYYRRIYIDAFNYVCNP